MLATQDQMMFRGNQYPMKEAYEIKLRKKLDKIG